MKAFIVKIIYVFVIIPYFVVGEDEMNQSQALVLYQPDVTVPPLSCFREKQRNFTFPCLNEELVIEQNWVNTGVSAVVWEAAIALAEYISNNLKLKGKDIIELGAGTGLVGMVAAKLGANVTLTDLPIAMSLLHKNIIANFPKNNPHSTEDILTVKELEWGKDLNKFAHYQFDYIIGADIVYIEDTFEDLKNTLIYLAKNGHVETKILLSCKLRYEREMNFINMLKKYASVKEVYSNSNNKICIFEAVLL